MIAIAATTLWFFLIAGNGQITISTSFPTSASCREVRNAVAPIYEDLGFKVTQCVSRQEPS